MGKRCIVKRIKDGQRSRPWASGSRLADFSRIVKSAITDARCDMLCARIGRFVEASGFGT